jgi:hydroxypyruvate isomerase
MPRFSANLGFLWAERPLLERIDLAAAAGFRAIELHWPYDVSPADVKAACARHGLTLLAINTARGNVNAGEFGLAAVPGRENGFHAIFDQSLAYCVSSGAQSIHVMAGVVPAWQTVEAAATFAENLSLAARKACTHGLTLLLEPLNPRDMPSYFYSTISRAAEMIVRVGLENIKIMYDVYHVAISEGDVIKRLERYLPMIGHVQIAAVPSRAEPDEGEISYPAVFKSLDALGYQGWIGCEYKPREGTMQGLGWVKQLGISL